MNSDSSDIYRQLECWFDNPAGQYLLEREREMANRMLEQVFGYHLLQLGVTRQDRLALDSTLNHTIVAAESGPGDAGLLTRADSLPFANDSIDVAVLHHSMDFAGDPHQLLREVQRVVAAQGHIIIIGFNPWSLFGIGTALRRLHPGNFWRGAAHMNVVRLRDWLHLLGSETRAVEYTYTTPPVGRGRLHRWLAGCDRFCTRHNWPLGGVYVLHAQKQVVPLTPLRLRWNAGVGGRLIGLGVAKPVPSPRGVDVAA
jgi:SAM-dependent methyltransferase